MTDHAYKFDDSTLKGFFGQFETRVGDGSGHPSNSYFELLDLLLCLNRKATVMDLGCGIGRATGIAKKISREVVALEPVKFRWSHCYESHHNEPTCRVFNQTSSEYIQENPNKTFDLIIVGMVLQHLATDVCADLLEDVVALLATGGTVLIYTSHTLEETKGFSFSGDPERFYVTEQEYNGYAKTKPADQHMGIPVRRFSKKELIESLPAQLVTIFWQQAAYYRKDSLHKFAEKYQV